MGKVKKKFLAEIPELTPEVVLSWGMNPDANVSVWFDPLDNGYWVQGEEL